jgi:alpha-L-fucosidase
MNAFIHFGIKTFTDKEWDSGDEPERVFNPDEANPGQWVSVLKAADLRK